MWRVAGCRLLSRGQRNRIVPNSSSPMERTTVMVSTFKSSRLWSSSTTDCHDDKDKQNRPRFPPQTVKSGSKNRVAFHRQNRQLRGPDCTDRSDLESLIVQTNGLLRKLCVSSTPVLWKQADLKQAADLANTWSVQRLPKDAQDELIPLADLLLRRLLKQPTCSENPIALPRSDAFCFMITSWSKSRLPNAAERAEYWLQQMIRMSEEYPQQVTAPRPSLFSAVLAAWEKRAKANPETAVRRGEALWQQLHQLCAENGCTTPASISSSSYYLYLSLWSKSGLPEAPLHAESVLREMINVGKSDLKVIPSCPVFVNAIVAWRKSNSFQSPYRAQAILDLLIEEYQRRSRMSQEWMHMTINDAPFNATISAWATAASMDGNDGVSPAQAEERINAILIRMNQLQVLPTNMTVWSALPAYSQMSDSIQNAPEKILRLLDMGMKQNADNNMLQNQIYLKAIELCCKQSSLSKQNLEATDIAEEILFQRYMKLPRKQRRLEPNMDAFMFIVEAWNKRNQDPNSRSHKAPERLHTVLKKMEEECYRIHEHKNNPSVYAHLAKAWAKSSILPEALNRTEENINRLLSYYKNQSEYTPRMHWFHDIISEVKKNYSIHCSRDFVDRLKRKLAFDSYFFRMIAKPSKEDTNFDKRDADLLGDVLDILASTQGKSSGKRAEFILLRMQELHEKGNLASPTFATFKKVLECWCNSAEEGATQRADDILLLAEQLYESGDKAMRPDMDGYMAVINAWSRSHSPKAPDMIKRHLVEIKKRRGEGDTTFKVNQELYAALIHAYANSGHKDGTIMAQAIFDATPDEMRSTGVYNALIEAQGGDSNRTEDILQVMHYKYAIEGKDITKPNTETFNLVLQAWLRSGSPMTSWRADVIFKRMQDLTNSGQLDVKPNARTFDLVVSALAQGVDMELKIESYLSLLKQHYKSGEYDCTPTVTSYTEAIRAWCSNDDDPRAFLRAKALLDEMHELARDGVDSVRPSRQTYEIYLNALSQSEVEARVELATDVLLKMRENHVHVDNDIRRYLQRCFVPVDCRLTSFAIKTNEFEPVDNLQAEWAST